MNEHRIKKFFLLRIEKGKKQAHSHGIEPAF